MSSSVAQTIKKSGSARIPRRKAGKSASVRLAAYARGTPMGRSAPRATAPCSASCAKRDRKVVTLPTGRGALSVQPVPRRRAIVTQRLRGSTLQSAWAARSASKRALRTLQQAAEEAGRLGRFRRFRSFRFLLRLGFGFLLALLAGEPFIQAHPRL